MGERSAHYFERLKAKPATAIALGVVTLAIFFGTAPSCDAENRVIAGETTVTPHLELSQCVPNGGSQDDDSKHLTEGEALAVFPGIVKIDSTIAVRPVVGIGKTGLQAGLLEYDDNTSGYSYEPFSQAELSRAQWKLDGSVARPGDTEKELKRADACAMPDAPARKGLQKVYVSLQSTGLTNLQGRDVTERLVHVPRTTIQGETNGLTLPQWVEEGAFGVSFDERLYVDFAAKNSREYLRVEAE